MSVNVNEDIIDVFLLYKNNKVKSNNSQLPNYYRINMKDIGVKDDFIELTFIIVNDIQITIKIKIKNKFSTQRMSIKDRLKFFNNQIEEQKKPEPQKYNTSKIKTTNYLKNEEPIKEENVKKEEINNGGTKLGEQSNEEELPQEEVKKEEEVQKNSEEQKEIEETKIEEKKEEETPKEEVKINKDEVFQENKKEEENEKKPNELNEIQNQKSIVKTNEKPIEKKIDNQNNSFTEIKKNPGKLKIPEIFQKIGTPTIEKKDTKRQIEEIKVDKPKEEFLSKEEENQKEEVKQNGEEKRPSKAISENIQKCKTTKENEIKNETPKELPTLPTIEEKVDSKINNSFFQDEGRKTLQLPGLNLLNEMFLEPTTYGHFLKEEKDRGIKHPYRETFCEGFFIASFPQKDGKVIEMSQSYPAHCKHDECSKFPSMKPEIIFRYPLQDTKTLELNNLAATICFPTGIKVCYNENENPIDIKDYVTSITNQKGERYYMMTYHFYLKMAMSEYQRYDENPLKYNLRKFADPYILLREEELTEEKINEIQKNMEFYQELGFRDIVFVPFCICLISKYPYVQEMKNCLKSIYTILEQPKENSSIVINDIIMYLIHAIPIPTKNTKVKFLVPYYDNCIVIDCPKLEDINIMNRSAGHLLNYFSIDNLILIFKLLINEKKILIIDEDYQKLSRVADGFVSIIYPFQWIHTYIPIMSDQMLKYLETFLPFLNGINKSLMPLVENVFKNGEIEEDDEVFLIYVSDEKEKIKLSSSLRGKKRRLDKYVNDNIPPLPSSLEKELRNKLKKLKNEIENLKKSKRKISIQDKLNIELQIRDAFIDFFVEIFHDYANYLSFLGEDTVFNKPLFIEKKGKDKKFYNEILDTQLFQQFTQNIINEDVGYFNSRIALKEENKKNSNNKFSKQKEIQKIYCINPDFLKIQNNNDNMKDVIEKSKEKYPENKTINESRILQHLFLIEDSKYKDNQCPIYMTPEEKELKKEEKQELQKPKKNVIVSKNNAILQRIKAMNLNASNSIKKKGMLTEKEIDNIKELIKDNVVRIFKSEEINFEQKEKTELLSKLNIPIGREFFVSLLSKNTSNIILLKEHSFTLLWALINNCTANTLKLEETNKILEEIVLLIKSTKYFGIVQNGETKTLFDKYKQGIQQFPKIRQDNFWQIWYETEIKKKENATDEDKQEIIYDICKILIELEMPKGMIKKITDSINIKLFGKGTELYQKTFNTFIKFIVNAKYVSQAI